MYAAKSQLEKRGQNFVTSLFADERLNMLEGTVQEDGVEMEGAVGFRLCRRATRSWLSE